MGELVEHSGREGVEGADVPAATGKDIGLRAILRRNDDMVACYGE